MQFELLFDPILVITVDFKAFCLYTWITIQTVGWFCPCFMLPAWNLDLYANSFLNS